MNVQKAHLQKADYCPPPPEGDFYRITDILDESERTVLKRVRDFMDREVAPIIEDYWVRDEFPFDLVPKIAALGIGGVGVKRSMVLPSSLCVTIRASALATVGRFSACRAGLAAAVRMAKEAFAEKRANAAHPAQR